MKLLIVTQKIDKNDDILGFFHNWVIEFAHYYEQVVVVALGVGKYDLPRNVKVLSLGKEKGLRKEKYLKNFYKYIFSERHNYDEVFVHMNPEYVLLGGLIWRLMGKKIGLWYTHKATNLKLFLASRLVDIIFSASPESFGLKNKKLRIMGHGIDTDKFRFCRKKNQDGIFRIVCIGRLAPIKNQKLLIETVAWLVHKDKFKNFQVDIIGSASDREQKYENDLQKLIQTEALTGFIKLKGSVSYENILEAYSLSDLSINLCPTGGMDKVVLESMACGVPVIVLNRTFTGIVPNKYLLKKAEPQALAQKIKFLSREKSRQENLRNQIVRHHSLENLIHNIVNAYCA